MSQRRFKIIMWALSNSSGVNFFVTNDTVKQSFETNHLIDFALICIRHASLLFNSTLHSGIITKELLRA